MKIKILQVRNIFYSLFLKFCRFPKFQPQRRDAWCKKVPKKCDSAAARLQVLQCRNSSPMWRCSMWPKRCMELKVILISKNMVQKLLTLFIWFAHLKIQFFCHCVQYAKSNKKIFLVKTAPHYKKFELTFIWKAVSFFSWKFVTRWKESNVERQSRDFLYNMYNEKWTQKGIHLLFWIIGLSRYYILSTERTKLLF